MAALGGDGLRLLSVSRPERQPESAALGGPGPGLCCWVSVFSCLSLACSYVGSLYVWKSELPRDHPAVIKRRFTSVLVVSSLSPLCVLLWRELTGIQPGTSLLTLMGFRLEGIFPAALLPLLLTMILFLGPLMQLSMDCSCDLADGLKVVLAPRSWARCLTDMRWLRNQVIAPLTEELVFRACMLPMLAPCTGLGPAVFTCPLFFGVAHFHHIFEQLRFRQSSVGSIFLSAAFQFSYTAVFGAYTAFLFIRTGKWPGRGRSWTEGLPAQPGPLTHSFKQRATVGLLGTARRRPIGPEAETGWLRSAPGRAGSPGRRREGPAAGAEHGARPKAEPSRPHPAGALPGGRGEGERGHRPKPSPPPAGPVPVGDPPRDLAMQNGYDLQRVSVNARVPATVRSDGSRSGSRRQCGAGCRGARVAGGARACARVSALRRRQGAARRVRAGPGLGRDQEPPVGPAVAAYPGDLGSRPEPRWIPARPSTSALHVRVHGARARWRAPPCLSVLLLPLLPLLPPPPPPLPLPPPPRRGKGAGNRVSRGRGPERHGPEGVRRAAGLPRASPPRESRLESAGAGRAHGEAGPRPLSYGHQGAHHGPAATAAAAGQWSGRLPTALRLPEPVRVAQHPLCPPRPAVRAAQRGPAHSGAAAG
ncbi:CAAX prenyl protease 2 isoform X4 [Balaenoptera musculus]|uniref:CAAX prenyl protease 2 n=1 Tax=Balaenoptera musculus TaxID=9771 RepID=A0A8B8Y4J7_BALMU|nr:CAAX prenyl protease 2 isoform X4 [Balaenoptera musculus]